MYFFFYSAEGLCLYSIQSQCWRGNPEIGVKLYLEAALTADRFATGDNRTIKLSLVPSLTSSQSFVLYMKTMPKRLKLRAVALYPGRYPFGMSISARRITKSDYKAARYAAKMLKKSSAKWWPCVSLAFLRCQWRSKTLSSYYVGLEILPLSITTFPLSRTLSFTVIHNVVWNVWHAWL
jgi:hypothetical protein